MKKQIYLLAIISFLLSGCTLATTHFKGEDLLENTPPKIEKAKVLTESKPVVSLPEKKAEPKAIEKTETPKTEAVHKQEAPKAEILKPAEKPAETKKVEEKLTKIEACPPPRADKAQKPLSETLAKGDRMHITVFREKDLTGDYQVNDKGMIHFPLIGDVAATGMKISALQEKIRSSLANGYLVKPDVSISRLPDCTPK